MCYSGQFIDPFLGSYLVAKLVTVISKVRKSMGFIFPKRADVKQGVEVCPRMNVA